MKKLMFLLVVLITSLSSCDLFDNDDECNETDLAPSQIFNMVSNGHYYQININNPDVYTVSAYVTYQRYSCGQDTKIYYTTPTRDYNIKSVPVTLTSNGSGYYTCSTTISNWDDEVQAILTVKIYGKNISRTITDVKTFYPRAVYEHGGKNVVIFPKFKVSF